MHKYFKITFDKLLNQYIKRNSPHKAVTSLSCVWKGLMKY